MVTTAEIDAEQRENGVAVPVAIARTVVTEVAVHQPAQSCAIEFVHHIKKIPPLERYFRILLLFLLHHKCSEELANGITRVNL